MTLKSILAKLGLSKSSLDYIYLPNENHIEVLNCWTTKADDLWYYQYLNRHFASQLTAKNSLLLAGIFGPKKLIKQSKSHTKLFYTGENPERFPKYEDQCQNIVDLVIGFDYIDHERYQRFPYWIEYFFPPNSNNQSIPKDFSNFVNRTICKDEDKKFSSLVCSHDDGKARTLLFNSLSEIDRVDSGGKYLNNTKALKEDYNNDKQQFIGHYKFNICPENSNREGYVTEKVFEAIKANTIPIYWGSNNNPEPDVLNKEAILFYNGPESLPGLKKQVAELNDNPALYKEFLKQPKFKPHAEEYIIHLFESLHSKIQRVLVKKSQQ